MIAFAIVFIYLLGTLAFGYRLNRKATKSTTVRAFFVADGALPLFAVSAMLFGDMIAGSSTTGTAGTGYSTGMAGGWAIWGSSFGCVLFSVCFSKFFFRIRPTGITTGPEAYGLRFDNKVRYLVLVFTLIPLSIIFSAQISAASMYLNSMLGMDSRLAMVVVVALFLVMALLGVTGVAEMNKVHSFVIFFGIAFASMVCLWYVGGPSTLAEALPATCFDPFVQGPFTVFAQFVGSALGFSISVTSINIGYSAKSIDVARRSHLIVAGLSALFAFFPIIIGLCGAVTFDGIQPDTVLFAMTNHVSPGLSGLAVMAVFAAIFSTGPWFLLSIANLVVRDVYLPFAASRGKEVSEKSAIAVSRVIMCGALVGSVLISGQNTSLLNTLMGASQIKAIAALLLMMGIYWKRITNAAAFAGLLGGGSIATVWYFMGYPWGIQPLWPGLIVAMAIFVVASFATSRTKVSDDYLAFEERLERNSMQARS